MGFGAAEEGDEGAEGWDAGQDDLAVSVCSRATVQGGELTPTFSSITPHRTSIVEFPVEAMAFICTKRKIEQTVVRSPRRKTPQSAIVLLRLMLRLRRRGMGRKKMIKSKAIVMPARP